MAVTITQTGYNEWFVLPYYVRFMAPDPVVDEVWEWCSDNITGWGLRPDKTGVDSMIYTHVCFHFKNQKTRDWFILRWQS